MGGSQSVGQHVATGTDERNVATGTATAPRGTYSGDASVASADFSYVVLHAACGASYALERRLHWFEARHCDDGFYTDVSIKYWQPTLGLGIMDTTLTYEEGEGQINKTRAAEVGKKVTTKLTYTCVGSSGERPLWGLLKHVWEPYKDGIFFIADFQTRGSDYYFFNTREQFPEEGTCQSTVRSQLQREAKEVERREKRCQCAREMLQNIEAGSSNVSELQKTDRDLARMCLEQPHLYLTRTFLRPEFTSGEKPVDEWNSVPAGSDRDRNPRASVYLPKRFVQNFHDSWRRDLFRLMSDDSIYPLTRPFVLLLDHDETLLELSDDFFSLEASMPGQEVEKHEEKISLLQRTLEKTLTYYFTVIHGIKFDRPFVVRLIQAHTLQPHSFRTFLLST